MPTPNEGTVTDYLVVFLFQVSRMHFFLNYRYGDDWTSHHCGITFFFFLFGRISVCFCCRCGDGGSHSVHVQKVDVLKISDVGKKNIFVRDVSFFSENVN